MSARLALVGALAAVAAAGVAAYRRMYRWSNPSWAEWERELDRSRPAPPRSVP